MGDCINVFPLVVAPSQSYRQNLEHYCQHLQILKQQVTVLGLGFSEVRPVRPVEIMLFKLIVSVVTLSNRNAVNNAHHSSQYSVHSQVAPHWVGRQLLIRSVYDGVVIGMGGDVGKFDSFCFH